MEGGAMRGLFTCGVIDVFLEENIEFDGGAGISAGAVFGCNYKSRQKGRPLRYNTTYCQDKRYCSIRSLITTGDLYGVDFCYRLLPDVLDVFDVRTFRDNPMKFYVGATDVHTGQAVYHLCTDGGKEDMLWMRASASMPVVSRPVKIGDSLYLDGGIAENVPYRFMEEEGFRRNVIILTQPKGFVKTENKALPLIRLAMKKYPAVIEAMERRHLVYNREMEEIAEREAAGESFVIRPPEALNIGRVEKDPEELRRVYAIGREEGLRVLNEVKAFLKGDDPQ